MKYLIHHLRKHIYYITDDFFKIIKSLQNENTFIISHKGIDILFDKFTNIIKFEKVHNFTRIKEPE